MDAVIEAIRGANGVAEARLSLTSSRFGLSEPQADALLSMQLRRLTALENIALQKEEANLKEQVLIARRRMDVTDVMVCNVQRA